MRIGSPSALINDPMLRTGIRLGSREDATEGQEQASDADDERMSGYQVLGLRLQDTELVVLASCRSGDGASVEMEGAMNLRRAFHIAGARSVLSALWDVEDYQASLLIKSFYGGMNAGKRRSRALQRAQIEMIKDPRYRHPYHWAGFELWGSWTKLNVSTSEESVPRTGCRGRRTGGSLMVLPLAVLLRRRRNRGSSSAGVDGPKA